MIEEGKNYEKLLNKDSRKSMGKYYTPDFIIDYILDMTLKKIDVLKNPFLKVLDPTCGTGFFLIKAYEILKEKFEGSILELSSMYSEETYQIAEDDSVKVLKGQEYWIKDNIHYHILANCIYGADLDGQALAIAEKTLLKKEICTEVKVNLLKCDCLIKWEDISFEEYKKFTLEASEENYFELRDFWQNEFDCIIGNPPFVVLLKSEMDENYLEYIEKNYKTLGYKRNAFYLIMERSIDKLKSGGMHSFIIPDRYFSSRSYINSRKKLFRDTEIINITNFSNKVFNDAVVGIACYAAEKNDPVDKHYFNLKLNYLNEDNFDHFEFLQNDILISKDSILNILTGSKHISLISKINKTADPLGDYCDVHVGMMIKDKRMHFIESELSSDRHRIVEGRDLSDYVVSNNERYCDLGHAQIFGGTKRICKQSKHPKIFLRKTGNRILAAIDEEGVYAEQSAYLVIPMDASVIYNLLGQLSSKLCSYLYREFLISNPSQYPYIQHYDVVKLPVNRELLADNNFSSLIKEMISLKSGLKCSNSHQDDEDGLKDKINKLVYRAYKLDPGEIEKIEEDSEKYIAI